MVGKSANREREIQGMQMIETFHGAQAHAVAVGDNVTMVEWEFDVTYKGAPRMKMCQVAVQRWKLTAKLFMSGFIIQLTKIKMRTSSDFTRSSIVAVVSSGLMRNNGQQLFQ
jgi:hypothetical protein